MSTDPVTQVVAILHAHYGPRLSHTDVATQIIVALGVDRLRDEVEEAWANVQLADSALASAQENYERIRTQRDEALAARDRAATNRDAIGNGLNRLWDEINTFADALSMIPAMPPMGGNGMAHPTVSPTLVAARLREILNGREPKW